MAIIIEMKAKYPKIGKVIRKWREDEDLRQIDVARAIGIKQPFLSNIETGKKDPSLEVLVFIHIRTKISLYELLGLKDPQG